MFLDELNILVKKGIKSDYILQDDKIIKITLKKLYFLSKNSKNQQKIREFLFIFDEVGEVKNLKLLF